MSFFAHLVSSLQDGSRSFIETTRRDIADFSSAIKQETRELLPIAAAHLPLQHQRHQDGPLSVEHSSDGSRGAESAAAPEAGDSASASAAASSAPPADSGGLHFNLERLSGRMLNLLPSMFGGEGERAGTQGSGGLSGSRASFPQSAAAAGSVEQRLKRVLHDRHTYEADPVDAGSSDGQPPAAFLALCQQLRAQHSGSADQQSAAAASSSPPLPFSASAIADCLRDPVVRALYEELVESSQSVAASAFWCRCFYAQQRVQDDERKRQKLQQRLAGIKQQQQQQQQAAGEDELAWEEEDDDGERLTAAAAAAAASPADAAEQHEEREDELQTAAAAAEEGAAEADAEDGAAAAADGSVCGLSPSPAGSESSGELIDQAEGAEEWTQQSDAADGSRRSPATAAADSAAAAQRQPLQRCRPEEEEAADYAEWE